MRGCFSTSTPQRENSRVPGHEAGPQIVRFSGHGRTSNAELTYHIIMRRQFATTAADVQVAEHGGKHFCVMLTFSIVKTHVVFSRARTGCATSLPLIAALARGLSGSARSSFWL